MTAGLPALSAAKGSDGRTDPQLIPIATKVERGERLTREDGLALFASNDLLTIGRLANLANTRRNGERVYFAANQHINPTNVCILRKTCVFCSYARLPKEDGAYRYTMDQVWAEAAQAQFRLTPSLNPSARTPLRPWGLRSASAAPSRWRGSTSRCSRGRSSDWWDPTEPEKRPPSGSFSAC